MLEERDFKKLGEELHHRLLARKDNLVKAEIKASRLSVGRAGEAPRFYPVMISDSKAPSKQ